MVAKPAPRRQCAKCPWKKGADPYEIPNYIPKKHRELKVTIAEPGSLQNTEYKLMACHETHGSGILPCIGWLVDQLGPGNNLPLRLAVHAGRVDANVETVGPQHERFEDTLPKSPRRARRGR